MTTILLAGKKVRVKALKTLGKGGEADVYRLGKSLALKIFKQPSHPDITSLPNGPEKDRLVREAQHRLLEHQTKLREFPKTTPSGLVRPSELALDKKGRVVGYAMPLVPSASELLMSHSDKALRKQISGESLVELFRRLHALVEGIHKSGIVIGDFNDLNVLVRGLGTDTPSPFAIDADSMQFGPFLCSMFTARFVDPRLCDQTAKSPMLIKPHSELSDWYAYAVMLFESLLWTSPFGGVHKPKDRSKRLSFDRRSLARVSVFDDDVRYPKPARPLELLPDDLLQYFLKVFENDHREVFPQKLLEEMEWTNCSDCGYQHARSTCPKCGVASPAISQILTIKGNVTARRVFPTPHTRGIILQADYQNGKLQYLFQENGKLLREDGRVVFPHPAKRGMRFRLNARRTVIGQGNRCVVLTPGKDPIGLDVDTFGQRPMFETTCENIYRITNGTLVRDGMLGLESKDLIGNVVHEQSLFWTGNDFGFGFYRAGQLVQGFTFTRGKRSVNDQVDLPHMSGQLVDAFALFSSRRCWFFTTRQEAGKLLNRCTVLSQNGVVHATHEATAGDGTWLGDIRGGCAATLPSKTGEPIHCLFVPTDNGIVRVDVAGSSLKQTRDFPDTEPFVDSSSRLFLAREGIYAIKDNEIHLLTIK
jgi:hypothetical protein